MKMYWKYLRYVVRHKWYVFVECCKMGIRWRGLVHDLSKFRPSEFIPYARYFYGNYTPFKEMDSYGKQFGMLCKEDIDFQFDRAWLYHQRRNPHHWQFWLLQEDDGPLKNIPMPTAYLKEMLCDWRGAGRAITGKDETAKWYQENKHLINLNQINRAWIEKKLGLREFNETTAYRVIQALKGDK